MRASVSSHSFQVHTITGYLLRQLPLLVLSLIVGCAGENATDRESGRVRLSGSAFIFYIQVEDDAPLRQSMVAGGVFDAVPPGAISPAIESTADLDLAFAEVVERSMLQFEAALPPDAEVAVVISGHNTTGCVFGDRSGSRTIHFCPRTLTDIAGRHPAFAARVRQVHIVGCNTAWPGLVDAWRAGFPGVTAVAGIAGKGPKGEGAANFFWGAFNNLVRVPACKDAWAARNSRWPETVDACIDGERRPLLGLIDTIRSIPGVGLQNWALQVISRCEGRDNEVFYGARKPVTVDRWSNAYNGSYEHYRRYLAAIEEGYLDPPRDTGAEFVDDHPTPRFHNTTCHAYLGALRLERPNDARIARLESEIAQSIRLVFFASVKQSWLEDHASEVIVLLERNPDLTARALGRALGQDDAAIVAPETIIQQLTGLDRGETIVFLDELINGLPYLEPIAGRLNSALRELDPAVIPEDYLTRHH